MGPDYDPYYYAKMRRGMARNDPMHALAGPLEHREYVRDFVGNDDGMLAAPSMAAAIPAYTGAKYLDELFRERGAVGNPLLHLLYSVGKSQGLFGRARSPASWDEIFAGYQGLFSGINDRHARRTPSANEPVPNATLAAN